MKVKLICIFLSIMLSGALVSCFDSRDSNNNGGGGVVATPYQSPSASRVADMPATRAGDAGFVLVDYKNTSIRMYDAEGLETKKFVAKGKPVSVEAKSANEIFVGDKLHGKIHVYDNAGTLLRSFGDVSFPGDMVISTSTNKLYVTDSKKDLVKVYDLATESLSFQFGGSGKNDGEMRWPTGIAINEKAGEIYVGEFINRRIQIFDLNGGYLRTITKTTKPHLTRPQGLICDSDGNLYVVDRLWHGIFLFDAAGNFVKTIGGYGDGKEQFKGPSDLIIKNGSLLVVNEQRTLINKLDLPTIVRSSTSADQWQMPSEQVSAADKKLMADAKMQMDIAAIDGFHYSDDYNQGVPPVVGGCGKQNYGCHVSHWSPNPEGPILDDGTTKENFCLTCHSATGPGSEYVGTHTPDPSSGNGFSFTKISCDVCHHPHRQKNLPNIKNIRLQIEYPKGSGKKQVRYQSRNDFTKGPSPIGGKAGICEVCHTSASLNHHISDGSKWDHYNKDWGTNGSLPACVACHRHDNEFHLERTVSGTGDRCVDCHSTAQASRQAVTPEFGLTGKHFTLKPVKEDADDQCLVCHDVMKHRRGKIQLKDPDDDTNLVVFTKFQTSGDLQRNGTAPAGEITQDDLMNNFCFKCHDSDGSSDIDNYSITTGGTASTPFNTGSPADVFGQFDTTNTAFHPVRGYRGNNYCNANTLVATYWNLKNAGTTLNCWDCHAVTSHGGSFADMVFKDTRADNPPSGTNTTYQNLNDAFCQSCHKANVYTGNDDHLSGGTRKVHAGDNNDHEDIGCRTCHAGIRKRISDGFSNLSQKGTIHGYNFTWPGSSPAAGETARYFITGTYIRGWRDDTGTGAGGQGTCWVGQCDNHRENYNGN